MTTILAGEAAQVLELLDRRLRAYATHGPDASDPTHALWCRHVQIMREEGSALRVLLGKELLATNCERLASKAAS